MGLFDGDGGNSSQRPEKIRVLVVDDSLVCREMIAQILDSDPAIDVVGQATDGREAIRMARELQPSLITMDIQMPGMDGVEATEEIMAYNPTPILVVSSLVSSDRTGPAFDAISAGALDVMEKPEPQVWSDLEVIGRDLIAKVKLLARLKVVTHLRGKRKRRPSKPRRARAVGYFAAVAIGSSTGGPSVLMEVIGGLPPNFPAHVFVAQHIAEGFVEGLVRWLARDSAVNVVVAGEGIEPEPGTVYVSPTGKHMAVDNGRIKLVEPEPQELYKPSVNVLFESMARAYGRRAVGVLLTGMGTDGALGLRAMHDCGARTIVQDETSSVVFGMPKAAVELGAADLVLPASRIADELTHMVMGLKPVESG